MKIILVLLGAGALLLASCSNEKGRYVELQTGKTIEIEKDPATGQWIEKESNRPVYIYVDTKTNDTIYGKTGDVINGHVINHDNRYWYEMDEEYKVKSGDYKYKVEEDGDIKIKTDDKKVKIDGETGEKKVKNDD